jgi:hypothetical protein
LHCAPERNGVSGFGPMMTFVEMLKSDLLKLGEEGGTSASCGSEGGRGGTGASCGND